MLGMIPVVLAVIVLLVVVVTIVKAYKKVGPNEVLIVTGAFTKGKPKVVKGSGAYVWPILQDMKRQSLDTFKLELDIENANTATQVPLNVDANAMLRVGSDSQMIATAAEKILGLDPRERDDQLSEMMKGQVRAILGKMLPENAANNYDEFQEKVLESTSPLMSNLGLEIISLQIVNVSDDNGYIDSLFAKDVADKQADAAQARAEAMSRARIAEADQDRIAQEAEQTAEQQVAERKKMTEIAKADYKVEEDTAKAKADQAYELQRAESSKKVIEAQGQAETIEQEQNAAVALKLVEVASQKAEAAARTVTINAEAERKAAEQTAEAKKVQGFAQAEIVKQTGFAEAEAAKAKGLAQAEAQKKQAEAMEKNGQFLIMQSIVENLPEMAKAIAEPLSAIEKMTVFNGTEGVANGVTGGMAQTFELVKQSTGLDLAEMMKQKAAGTLTIQGDMPIELAEK